MNEVKYVLYKYLGSAKSNTSVENTHTGNPFIYNFLYFFSKNSKFIFCLGLDDHHSNSYLNQLKHTIYQILLFLKNIFCCGLFFIFMLIIPFLLFLLYLLGILLGIFFLCNISNIFLQYWHFFTFIVLLHHFF